MEDEKESSSSEEEEDDRRRVNDDLLGKVAYIQTGPDQACWFHALVSFIRLSELAWSHEIKQTLKAEDQQ